MLIRFFTTVRRHGVSATPKELLTLLEALDAGLGSADADAFYELARLCLVKDETQFDRFDRAFADFYEGLEALPNPLEVDVPEDWLRQQLMRDLNDEEKAALEAMGSLDELLATLEERLKEQEGRHERHD